MTTAGAAPTASAPGSVLTLHAILRALALLLSGPLVVLGFVIGPGVPMTILVLGLDLLVWGKKSPPRFEQITWTNVPVLGGMSRTRMAVAGTLGMVFFLVAAAVAAPLPAPVDAALSFSNTTPTIGHPLQAQLHLSGNVYYALFRDASCTDKLRDAGRAQFKDGPIPPSDPITMNDAGIVYWRATLEGNTRSPALLSDCVLMAAGQIAARPQTATSTSMPLAVSIVVASGGTSARADVRFRYGGVSYAIFSDSSCSRFAQSAGDINLLGSDGTIPGSTVVMPAHSGVQYWQGEVLVDGRAVDRSVCAPVTVPKNATRLSATLGTGLSVGAVPGIALSLAGATSDARGAVSYALFSDAACSSTGIPIGAADVQGGVVTSATLHLDSAGGFYWSAAYSGDADNESARSDCVPVTIARGQPMLTTGGPSGTVGGAIPQPPKLVGASRTASGTVTYFLYGDPSCVGQATSTDVAVSGGVFPAPTLLKTGLYSIKANYSGDTNNAPATSLCWPVTVGRAKPSLSLRVAASASIGSPVRASLSISGGFTPTGTVKYVLANDADCRTQPEVDGGTASLAGSTDSQAITFNNVGVAYWQATYSGDENNEATLSSCLPTIVNPNRPTLTASLSSSTVSIGGQASMSASLSGATTNAGGQMTFTAYNDSSCTANPPVSAGVRALLNGKADSAPLAFSNAGTVWWQAAYSGDGNNVAAKSACLQLSIIKARPILSVRLSTNSPTVGDTVTLNALLSGATSSAGGTVSYTRYTGTGCSSTGATSIGVVTVTNGVAPVSQRTQLASTGLTYWMASYSGDGNNENAASSCISVTVAQWTDPCGAPPNPFHYTFCGGILIYATPSTFCTYFSCISTFSNGVGYVVQCNDGLFSRSGGISGSCSGHSGNRRALFSP